LDPAFKAEAWLLGVSRQLARPGREPGAELAVGHPDGQQLAVIAADGTVTRCQPASFAAYLAEHPILIRYATAFRKLAAVATAFLWADPAGTWNHVRMRNAPTASPGEPHRVLMELAPGPLPAGLTPRELDVLTLIAGGLSNAAIAFRLSTSPKTIATHVEHLLNKLGVTARASAAAVAAERGYLRLPVPGSGPGPRGLAIAALHGAGEQDVQREAAPQRTRRSHRPSVLIGSAFPLHGEASNDGQELRHGSALAVAELNARGGVAGRRVEQVVVDADIFTPDGIRNGLTQLFDAGVDAITTGYVFAEDTAMNLASEYGAPYLHAMASQTQAEAVAENRSQYRNIFQVCPTESHYGIGFLHFLNRLVAERKWRPPNHRLMFVETPLPSGQMVNPLTVKMAERCGWDIEGVHSVSVFQADWSACLAELRRVNPAAVMVSHFIASELAAFQAMLASEELDTLVYAVYAPSVPEFLERAGSAAEGLIWAVSSGTYSDQVAVRFFRNYRSAFARQPGRSLAGLAYDQIHLLGEAWSRGVDPHQWTTVSDGLRHVIHRGVNGVYYLDSRDQSALAFPHATTDPSLGQAHLIFQVQQGRHRIIDPVPYAESSFCPPPWLRRDAAKEPQGK
jgi:branched-chain amino acid transport system substrate-binding protein